VSLGRSGPGFRSGFLETPRPRFGGVFLASAQTVSQSAVPGASTPRVRRRSEAVNIDHGQLVGRRLKDCPVVVGVDNLAPVNRRATGWRDGRRFERFAEVCQDLTSRGRSRPGLRPLANLRFEVSRLLPAVFSEPDVAATGGARQWKLLAHPRHAFHPRFCARCRASGAFDARRSSLSRNAHRPHARRSPPRPACRRSRSPATSRPA
jgi:hypothetical protein